MTRWLQSPTSRIEATKTGPAARKGDGRSEVVAVLTIFGGGSARDHAGEFDKRAWEIEMAP